MTHTESYWTKRYQSGQIQWDAGSITTPLQAYFDQLVDKEIKILIPGCGNAYEAEYLWNNGFFNVYIADISDVPLKQFKLKNPDFPSGQLLHADFFTIEDQFDLIVEQTFFCALHPSERQRYAHKVFELLKKNGKLMGVLFDDPLFKDYPPYGGNKNDYLPVFEHLFTIEKFERCYNSIKPRMNRELFIRLLKV